MLNLVYLSGELPAFEDAWKGNARKHLPGRTEGIRVNDGMAKAPSISF